MRIDAHQHFWKFDPVRDSWINDDMSVIRKDFLPDDLESILTKNNFDGCVAVQAAQSEEETEFLLGIAYQHSFVKGVVGWVNLKRSNLQERLEWFSQFKLLKGFRHVVQAEAPGFLNDQRFRNGIKILGERQFTYDILVYPHQLNETIEFIRQFPNQKFIIDHLAKPSIKDKQMEEWKRDLSFCAEFENVSCKLSGIVTEADWKDWKAEDFTPYLDIALEKFGSNRLIYGSDWPVCLLAASYKQQLDLIEDYISKLSTSEKNQIMGENAERFYNL